VSGGVNDAVKPPSERARAGHTESKIESKTETKIEVELEVSRGISIRWTIMGFILGGLLIWKLGTVGVWAGFALVAMGAYHAWKLAQTFLHPPGAIVISDREVSLPRGVCVPRPVLAKPSDVTAAYFLRRSVPWNRAAPVLIVELGPKAMVFPRDWFASEADQRRVIHALLRDNAGGKAGVGAQTAAGDDKSA
jgi:hypothetical protein